MEIVAADVGGTHARFACAQVVDGAVRALGPVTRLRAADHVSFAHAYRHFTATLDRSPPGLLSAAIAAPVAGDTIKLTNNPWTIRRASLASDLGVDRAFLINDLAAVAHAVPGLAAEHLTHLAGPDLPLSSDGTIAVIGLGTGLGAAILLPSTGGNRVLETEAGHIEFASTDTLEDTMLARLRARYGRVSVERMASGPGLANIYETFASIEGRPAQSLGDADLWARALDGSDDLARAALDRLLQIVGGFAGDLALAQGAQGLVVSGGNAVRAFGALGAGGFARRLAAKGRFGAALGALPVKLVTHPEPGVLGAAAYGAAMVARG